MIEPTSQWVVFVADDADDRFLVQQAFKALGPGYVLQALASGEELFELLEQTPDLPRLLLVDLNMPSMSGFEILAHLRSQAPYGFLPVIVLTSSKADQDRQRARQLGATDYFLKPNSLSDLIQLVKDLQEQWLA